MMHPAEIMELLTLAEWILLAGRKSGCVKTGDPGT
jgi:hypothetical protein